MANAEAQASISLDTTAFERGVMRAQDALKNLSSQRGERGASSAVGALAGVGAGVDSLGSAAERLGNALKLGLGAGIGVAFAASLVDGMKQASDHAIQLESQLGKIGDTARRLGEIAPQGISQLADGLNQIRVMALQAPQDFIGRLGEFVKYGGATLLSLLTTGGLKEAGDNITKDMLAKANATIRSSEPSVVGGIGTMSAQQQEQTNQLTLQIQHRENLAKWSALEFKHAQELLGIETQISHFRSMGMKSAENAVRIYKDSVLGRQEAEKQLFQDQQTQKLRELDWVMAKQSAVNDRSKPFGKQRGSLVEVARDMDNLSRQNDPVARAEARNRLAGDLGSLQQQEMSMLSRPTIADSLQRVGGGGGFDTSTNATTILRDMRDIMRQVRDALQPRSVEVAAQVWQ